MTSSARRRQVDGVTRCAWALALVAALCPALASAQAWKPLLAPDRAIDWSAAGVGGIPPRATVCARLTATATVNNIDAALGACPAGQTVLLEAGTYSIAGTIHVPANVTLRGAGADRTILNATGSGQAVIAMGNGDVASKPVVITGGATAGSAQIELYSAAGVVPGTFLAIAEQNDPRFVTAAGSGGNCNWCDGGWTRDGGMARGQIVAVTSVRGAIAGISPALYGAYTHGAVAVPFDMAASFAGVEDLQVRANNTGYETNFKLSMCAYCWIEGVESNYADGDHVDVLWGFHDEIRSSYFSNAYRHAPGAHDSDVDLALKTTATLVENNIMERLHDSVMLEWGAAGNVIAYNYMMGEFDSGAPNVVMGSIDFHGAHPQFNLLEGNVLGSIYADSVWGSSSGTTAFRNWVVGTSRVCTPLEGRATVSCAGANGHFAFQAARAVQLSYLATRNNLVGNVLGSAQMQSLRAPAGPVPQTASIEYPAHRAYETATAISFGYGSENDDGQGNGCGGGVPPCHAAGTSQTDGFNGNFNNITGATEWLNNTSRTLPASFYLEAKPAWWGSLPYPAIGPDVKGAGGPAGHSAGNPAETCYTKIMGGSDGGPASPLTFDAKRCYGGAY
ncbi:MAG: hypothetical protein WCF17_14500 [Terracidiphilus sp.]